MPNYLDIDPDQLRKMAWQHEQWAKSLHEWGKVPEGWLKRFQSEYGTIADPVRHELNTYYQNRHEKAEFLVRKHLRTRDELLATAAALEEGDRTGGGDIHRVGGGGAPAGTGPIQPAPIVPAGSGRDTPSRNGIPPESKSPVRPGRPPATVPEIPAADTNERPGPAGPMPAATMAQTFAGVPTAAMSGAPAGAVMPEESVPVGDVVPSTSEADPRVFRVDATGTGAWDSAPTDSSGSLGTAPGISFGPPAGATVAAGGMEAAPGGTSAGFPHGLAAAISDAKRRHAADEPVPEDLALARALLAGVLAAAAKSAPGLEWAVAISRNPRKQGRLVIALTSNEGRGWLPPGLFLPREVMIPWQHDSVLGPGGQRAIAALEGTLDPARFLVEFGSRVSQRANFEITALASSTAVSDEIRTALGAHVGVTESVSSEESTIDLTKPNGGLVDRLAMAGSDEFLRRATTIPEDRIAVECLRLATAADLRLRTVIPMADRETVTRRAWRAQIFDALHAGRSVPSNWWDQIRGAVGMQATAVSSRRIDLSGIPIGSRVDLPATTTLRAAMFERRADELLLLSSATRPDRQTLRDVLYSYSQIVEHPSLAAETSTVTTKALDTGVAIGNIGQTDTMGSPFRSAVSAEHENASVPVINFMRTPVAPEASDEQRRA